MSDVRPGLLDQLWAAIWTWLERHDSLAGALVSVGLGGVVTWLAWRTRQIRERQRENRRAAMEQGRQIAHWRRRVDQELDMLRDRIIKAEASVKHITSQIGEVISRLGRVDERQREAEERSSKSDERIEMRISETNSTVRDVSRDIKALLLRNRRVDSADDVPGDADE